MSKALLNICGQAYGQVGRVKLKTWKVQHLDRRGYWQDSDQEHILCRTHAQAIQQAWEVVTGRPRGAIRVRRIK